MKDLVFVLFCLSERKRLEKGGHSRIIHSSFYFMTEIIEISGAIFKGAATKTIQILIGRGEILRGLLDFFEQKLLPGSDIRGALTLMAVGEELLEFEVDPFRSKNIEHFPTFSPEKWQK